MEQRIKSILENNPLSGAEIIKKFPKKLQAKARASLSALILGNKIGLKDGLFFYDDAKPSKMHNKKVEIDGYKFDSIKESERYMELKVLYRKKIIKNLCLQPSFKIVDRVKFNGKTLCARKYIADFMYFEDGVQVVEDVKSEYTIKDPVYTLKRQLFLLQHPEIDFREIL